MLHDADAGCGQTVPVTRSRQTCAAVCHPAVDGRGHDGARLVHEVMRSLPGMFGLFGRLVSGRTSLDQQLERRSIRALVGVLGG